jgi:hypothetical protein
MKQDIDPTTGNTRQYCDQLDAEPATVKILLLEVNLYMVHTPFGCSGTGMNQVLCYLYLECLS